MAAPSLRQLVRRALVKNITSMYLMKPGSSMLTRLIVLVDVGDIPYEVIRPILLKIENPQQLVGRCSPRSLCSYLPIG